MSYKESFIFLSVCSISLLMGVLIFIAQQSLVDFSVLEHYDPGAASRVLDCDGQELVRFQYDKREPIAFDSIPQHFINALIAAEDRYFFSHHGLSWRGIVRSTLVNLYRRKIVQGASTITQQLVKLLFFSQERTFKRKVKEIFTTVLVEQQFTKEQILETYSNHICFGMGIYGVQAAAKRFWNKNAQELTLAQSALLAGIIPSPAHYNPLAHPQEALIRRNLVLRLMFEQKHISQAVYEAACMEPLGLSMSEKKCASHVREMLRIFLENVVGREQLYTAGLTIQITLSKSMQEIAESVFNTHVSALRKKIPIDGGLLCIDSQTGGIRALVGGYDFAVSQFNRVEKAYCQLGSITKVWIYALASEQGRLLSDTEFDEPFELNGWQPRNFNRRFEGIMTLARALAVSNNIIAIKMLLQVGIPNLIALLQKLHLPGPFPPYPSLALGCTECSLEQAVAAFNIFAHKGVYQKPYLIEWIKDKLGKKIWRHTPISEPIISWAISSKLVHVLKLVPQALKNKVGGTWPMHESFGKTGTTNDARRCWYIGSSADGFTTGISLGADDNRPLAGQFYASRHVVPLWRDFHAAWENHCAQSGMRSERKVFYHHPQLRTITINAKTGAESSAPGSNGTLELLV